MNSLQPQRPAFGIGAMTLARFEITRQLRSPFSWLSLALLAMISGLTGRWLGTKATTAQEWVAQADSAQVADLEFWGSASVTVETLMALLKAHPPLLLATFAGALMLVPTLALTFGYDQTATDIRSKHCRFLLTRLSRDELYLGKTLAALGMLAGAWTLTLALAGGAYLVTATIDTGGEALMYLVRIWATTIAATVPYVTFLGLLNAICGRGWLTLMLCFILWTGLTIVGAIGSAMDAPVDVTSWLFPNYARHTLASDTLDVQALTWAHGVVFSLITYLSGMWWFRRRDL